METSRNVFAALLDILLAPGKALRAAREHAHWFWVPLASVFLLNAAFWSWYYLSVDITWLADFTFSQAGVEMPAEQREQAASFMKPGILLASTLIGLLVMLFLTHALVALYLLIVSKVSGDEENGFGRWFGTSVWSAFPGVLSVLAMALNYGLAESNQIAQHQLAVTNLAALLQLAPTHPWGGLAGAIDLTVPWSIALLGLGISLYTKRGYGKSLALAAAPFAVIYGIWALFILL